MANDDSHDGSPDDRAAALILDEDVPCEGCGFNLRGLPTRHACPECGVEYEESTEFDWVSPQDKALARKIGFHADAMLYVRICLNVAGEAAEKEATATAGDGGRHPDRRPHVTAGEVCRAVREAAEAFFQDEATARWLLGAWGLRRSEDVGRLVFGLVDAGALTKSDDDDPADFDGLFTLDDLFVRPHPRLDSAATDDAPATPVH